MAATIGKAEGSEAILNYIRAFKSIEAENSNIALIEAQEQQIVLSMVGDVQMQQSNALSGINHQILTQSAQNIERFQSVLDSESPKVILYFTDIKATQNQQQYIGYILVPEEGKKITVDNSNNIIVDNT